MDLLSDLPPSVSRLAETFAQATARALEAEDGARPSIDQEWHRLGERAAGLVRIYLDKNVWIWLRDVQLGREADARHIEISDRLGALADAGTHMCPASDVLFVELLGQRDRDTRLATARVIDRLAGGIALAPQPYRAQMEFFHWIMASMAPGRPLGNPLAAAWLPLPHLLGPMVPHQRELPGALNEALQYAWLHASSKLTLTEMLEMLGEPPEPETVKVDFAERMTEGKNLHAGSGGGYAELLLAEIEGGVDSYAESLEAAVRQTSQVLTGNDPGALSPSAVRGFGRLIAELVRQKKLGAYLPTLQVGAAYHARIRSDLQRRYKPGDWLDAIHAAGSVPYCDILLTESSLRHLLTTNPSDVASRFNCRVVSDPTEMISVLEDEIAPMRERQD